MGEKPVNGRIDAWWATVIDIKNSKLIKAWARLKTKQWKQASP